MEYRQLNTAEQQRLRREMELELETQHYKLGLEHKAAPQAEKGNLQQKRDAVAARLEALRG